MREQNRAALADVASPEESPIPIRAGLYRYGNTEDLAPAPVVAVVSRRG